MKPEEWNGIKFHGFYFCFLIYPELGVTETCNQYTPMNADYAPRKVCSLEQKDQHKDRTLLDNNNPTLANHHGEKSGFTTTNDQA